MGGLGLGYTAHEALKSAAVTRVDVVEYLPQVIGRVVNDGIRRVSELAGRLRERTPNQRVLFVSGYSRDDAEQAGADELDAFLEKPFTARRLRDAVRKILDACTSSGSIPS